MHASTQKYPQEFVQSFTGVSNLVPGPGTFPVAGLPFDKYWSACTAGIVPLRHRVAQCFQAFEAVCVQFRN